VLAQLVNGLQDLITHIPVDLHIVLGGSEAGAVMLRPLHWEENSWIDGRTDVDLRVLCVDFERAVLKLMELIRQAAVVSRTSSTTSIRSVVHGTPMVSSTSASGACGDRVSPDVPLNVVPVERIGSDMTRAATGMSLVVRRGLQAQTDLLGEPTEKPPQLGQP
jgi:hypothetical protein